MIIIRKKIKLGIGDRAHLPTILTAMALRLDKFTVVDDRSGSGYWFIETEPLDIVKIQEILDVTVTPAHMTHVHSFEDVVEAA